MKKDNVPYVVNSISEQCRLLTLPKPQHPLINVFNFADITQEAEEISQKFTMNFYCIAIKKDFTGKLKYGQNYYDFDEGVMSFIAPGQVLHKSQDATATKGWCLVFHPDLIASYSLAKHIKSYGFFSYALNEALHLSEKEEEMVTTIVQNIQRECSMPIDSFSQDVIVSHLELLLTYSNRFYNRQFITRKLANNDLLSNLEAHVSAYLNSEEISTSGLPTVQYLSGKLNVSASYLSDMLRTLTGQNTQQYIHTKLIDKAKEILSTTNLSVSEIAYKLGFEYPQSFNKLFKSKTNISPLQFRQSFN